MSKIHTILYHFRFIDGKEDARSVGTRPGWSTRKKSGQQGNALYSKEDTERAAQGNGKAALTALPTIVQEFGSKGIRVIFSILLSYSLNWPFWPQLFLPPTELCFLYLLRRLCFFLESNFAI